MKRKHIFHVAFFVVILFGGYQVGQAIYVRFLRPATGTTPPITGG